MNHVNHYTSTGFLRNDEKDVAHKNPVLWGKFSCLILHRKHVFSVVTAVIFVTKAKSTDLLLCNPNSASGIPRRHLSRSYRTKSVSRQIRSYLTSAQISCILWLLLLCGKVCLCLSDSLSLCCSVFEAVWICVTPRSLPLGLCSVYGAV